MSPSEESAGPGPFDPARRPRREVFSVSSLMLARLLRLKPKHGPKVFGQIRRDSLEVPRWALTLGLLMLMILFIAILALLFVPVQAHAASEGINFDKPVKDWYQGPVRYIITKQEVKAYKALENEAERANFIDWFWERRDVVPATPQNEFRDRFEMRVFEATRMFSETTKPGWKTDMGKIYILVGKPDEVTRDVMAKTHRGIITWTYRRPPFPDLPANTVVAFAKDVSGEFVISTSPTLDSDVARGLGMNRIKLTADGRYLRDGIADPALLDAGVPMHQGPLETMMIAGRLQQLPPAEEEMFRSFAVTKEFYGAIPAESRLDFYRAGDGSTYTTITIGIRSSAVQYRERGGKEMPDVAVFGKLVGSAEPKQEYPLAGDASFAGSAANEGAGPDDLLIFQATGGFRPGTYELVLGVQDRVSRKIAAYRKHVEIPDLSAKTLTLSSITLAASMEPGDFLPAAAKPFHLGKFVVVPQPDQTFRPADELNVYFQVYEPAVDAGTGKPRLDVMYTFSARQTDGSLKEIGTYAVPDSTAQVQGYAVPLEKWPPGEYQVSVLVRDEVGNTTASRSVLFVIAP